MSSSEPSRVTAALESLKGKVKEEFGAFFGQPGMAQEGVTQQRRAAKDFAEAQSLSELEPVESPADAAKKEGKTMAVNTTKNISRMKGMEGPNGSAV